MHQMSNAPARGLSQGVLSTEGHGYRLGFDGANGIVADQLSRHKQLLRRQVGLLDAPA